MSFDIDYDEGKVEQLWRTIQSILLEQGGVLEGDLATKTSQDISGWSEATIRHGVLPRLRHKLVKRDLVEVDGGEAGKTWKLVEEAATDV